MELSLFVLFITCISDSPSDCTSVTSSTPLYPIEKLEECYSKSKELYFKDVKDQIYDNLEIPKYVPQILLEQDTAIFCMTLDEIKDYQKNNSELVDI